jgi:hypothetical protein
MSPNAVFYQTSKKIHELIKSAKSYWEGFIGTSCCRCEKTANVPAHHASWFCECSQLNEIPYQIEPPPPHDTPKMGPSQETIINASRSFHLPRGD